MNDLQGDNDNQVVFKDLLDNAADIVTVIDAQGIILYQSTAITTYLGFLPKDVIGKSIFAFLHPDDLYYTIKAFAGLMTGEDTDRIVTRLRNNQDH